VQVVDDKWWTEEKIIFYLCDFTIRALRLQQKCNINREIPILGSVKDKITKGWRNVDNDEFVICTLHLILLGD
jgi:hypothetical protein